VSEAVPSGLLAAHPDTAYFWGHVAGAGTVERDRVVVAAPDGTCAERLAAVAGGGRIDHDRIERPYAHDTDLTKTEDEYTVTVTGGVVTQGSAAFGLPTGDEAGGYRFDVFADHRRPLLRGLLESCGTVCFNSAAATVGISFVHDDRALLETIDRLLAASPVDAPTGGISETSSGGYWFGIGDDAAGAFGAWVYDGSDDRDLFAPTRRRKLRQSLDRAAELDSDPAAGAGG
jgi:hypothetical protein